MEVRFIRKYHPIFNNKLALNNKLAKPIISLDQNMENKTGVVPYCILNGTVYIDIDHLLRQNQINTDLQFVGSGATFSLTPDMYSAKQDICHKENVEFLTQYKVEYLDKYKTKFNLR